jgi:hypothetical protein
MSLKEIRNLDYTILLCRKMKETRTWIPGSASEWVRRCSLSETPSECEPA